MDPGIRTFQTCYSPNGTVTEWGRSDISRIYRLCHSYDELQSQWMSKTILHRKRYRLKRAGMQIHRKIRNLVDDLHKKLVRWLCENHTVILLPSFETSKMVCKTKRKINCKAARAMLTWSHYRFKVRLLHKVREFPWCKVIICDEAYTSKTCGKCGSIHDKLGSSKVFTCPECNFTLDRDVNGARNILIRYLTIHHNSNE